MYENLIIENWFGTFSTASGGTRTDVKLSRPWQTDIIVDPATCPFCTKDEPDVSRHVDGSGLWRVLQNVFTPFPLHYLIIPGTCWTPYSLRNLGGRAKIEALMRIVTQYVKEEHPDKELWMFINIGFLGGQNLGHYHAHLLEPIREKNKIPLSEYDIENINQSPLVIFENNLFKVILGGFAARQCFFYPKTKGVLLDPRYINQLSRAFNFVVSLYNDRFRSLQNLSPDFTILAKFVKSEFHYATYIPALGNWWGCAQMMAIMEGTPFILAWPHEKTFQHLMVKN